jgi:hypothetical protein
LELRILFEETLKRFPKIEIVGKPLTVESTFLNQLKTLAGAVECMTRG